MSPHEEYKLYYEQWHQILADIIAYMSSLFCEGCLAAAAVVVRLRFAVENVPAKGALGSSRDNSFYS